MGLITHIGVNGEIIVIETPDIPVDPPVDVVVTEPDPALPDNTIGLESTFVDNGDGTGSITWTRDGQVVSVEGVEGLPVTAEPPPEPSGGWFSNLFN
jgi:hypothetical protein